MSTNILLVQHPSLYLLYVHQICEHNKPACLNYTGLSKSPCAPVGTCKHTRSSLFMARLVEGSGELVGGGGWGLRDASHVGHLSRRKYGTSTHFPLPTQHKNRFSTFLACAQGILTHPVDTSCHPKTYK
jgi:hypothetical protein